MDLANVIDSLEKQLGLEFEKPSSKLLIPQYQLREYQQDAIKQILSAFQKYRRVCYQLPTGGGKTVVFSYIAKEFLKKGEGVLVLTHREELLAQAHEKLESVSGIPAGKIKSGCSINLEYDIQVASIQTLVRRKYSPKVGLIIVDEAHHSCSQSYTKIFDRYPNTKILGVTATPNRSDGQGLKKQFDTLITSPPISWFIENKYLSKYKIFTSSNLINTKEIKKSKGDFETKALSKEAIRYTNDAVVQWLKIAKDKQTLVFCVDISHSNVVTEAFEKEGIDVAQINGKTPYKTRKELIESFKKKEIKVLVNCGIFIEGFDCPNVEVIQCLRPTMSLTLWLQVLGRALRVSENKEYSIILDHTENTPSLGFPDSDFEWSLDPISLDYRQKYTQSCKKCDHIFRPLSHENKIRHSKIYEGNIINFGQCLCPNCNSEIEFEINRSSMAFNKKPLKEGKNELREMDNSPPQEWVKEIIDSLEAIQTKENFKKSWIKFKIEEMGEAFEFNLSDWRYLAKILGYKEGWAWYQWQEYQAN